MNYLRIYNELITRAKLRSTITPCEIHHILPRSMGGSDDPENLVALTPREHFIAHKLLWKINGAGPMATAFVFMSDLNNITSGKAYAAARAQVSLKQHNTNVWLDNKLIHKSGKIVEFTMEYLPSDFCKDYPEMMHAGAVRTILRGDAPSRHGWALLPEFRVERKSSPAWVVNIKTKEIKFVNTPTEFAQLTGGKSGGAYTSVLMGKQKSIRGWRLATEDEIHDQS